MKTISEYLKDRRAERIRDRAFRAAGAVLILALILIAALVVAGALLTSARIAAGGGTYCEDGICAGPAW